MTDYDYNRMSGLSFRGGNVDGASGSGRNLREPGSDINYTYSSRLGSQHYGTAPTTSGSAFAPPSPLVDSSTFAQTPAMVNKPPVPVQSPNSKENTHRFIGYCVGIASVCAEHVLSHPCIVLRRQCQVNHDSKYYHTTPVTLLPVIFNIQSNQSVTTLWKGIGSKFMVRGITAASEAAISEFTPLPKEVNRHSSPKKHLEHLLLEGLSIIITTPFFAASLVETVQSEIACEQPGVFDCLREGINRLIGWSNLQQTRLLPVYKILIPVCVYGLSHYIISSMAQYTVLMSVKQELIEDKELRQEEPGDQSIYEVYYPELIATFTGNLLADTMLFPLETVMHRLLLQGTRTIIDQTDGGQGVIPIITRYEGSVDCVRTILREEGTGGFYKGFGSLLLQYGLHMGILRLTKFILQQISNHNRPPFPNRHTPVPRRPETTSSYTQMTPQVKSQPLPRMPELHESPRRSTVNYSQSTYDYPPMSSTPRDYQL